MSTSYYRLKKPFTWLRADVMGGHTQVWVWVNCAKAGGLVFRNEEAREAIRIFFSDEEVMSTHWGGIVGAVVSDVGKLPDEAVVLSEYGELLSAGKVRKRQGARRKDGHPTELFGYEDEEKEASEVKEES